MWNNFPGVFALYQVFFFRRLVQATARVSCDIRHVLQTKKKMKENEISKEDSPKTETSVENGEEDVPQDEGWERDAASASSSAVFLWTRHPGDSEARSDEDIVTQALYAVISPLLSEKEDLWRREFNKIFELEYADDHKGSPGTCDLEVAVKQVLLEWGYGDEDDSFLGGESKPAYEMPDGSDIIKATQEGQQMIAEDTADEKETEEVPKEEGNKETEEVLGRKEEELSNHGSSIMNAALHMYSLLIIHHCCCIMAPSGTGKSVVWKVKENQFQYREID